MSASQNSSPDELQRYHLRLQAHVFEAIDEIARREGVDRLTILRAFIKTGLHVYEAQKDATQAGDGLYSRVDGEDTKIVVLF